MPELIEAEVLAGVGLKSFGAFVGILADGLFEREPADVAVCTGLEGDHLDVHRSIEQY